MHWEWGIFLRIVVIQVEPTLDIRSACPHVDADKEFGVHGLRPEIQMPERAIRLFVSETDICCNFFLAKCHKFYLLLSEEMISFTLSKDWHSDSTYWTSPSPQHASRSTKHKRYSLWASPFLPIATRSLQCNKVFYLSQLGISHFGPIHSNIETWGGRRRGDELVFCCQALSASEAMGSPYLLTWSYSMTYAALLKDCMMYLMTRIWFLFRTVSDSSSLTMTWNSPVSML